MRESRLENEFCKRVSQAGGKAYKFISPGNDGVPDRLVIFPGDRICFVELKRPGEQPRKKQVYRMNELAGFGCHVAVVDKPECIGSVIEWIKALAPKEAL